MRRALTAFVKGKPMAGERQNYNTCQRRGAMWIERDESGDLYLYARFRHDGKPCLHRAKIDPQTRTVILPDSEHV